jgi:hypothetical protein
MARSPTCYSTLFPFPILFCRHPVLAWDISKASAIYNHFRVWGIFVKHMGKVVFSIANALSHPPTVLTMARAKNYLRTRVRVGHLLAAAVVTVPA